MDQNVVQLFSLFHSFVECSDDLDQRCHCFPQSESQWSRDYFYLQRTERFSMRWIIIICFVLLLSTEKLVAAESPLVENYLHSGQLAKGQQVLEAALAASPKDDQIRFGLGVLQLVRSVERLGQSLHEFGCQSENTRLPFVRLPVPANPRPTAITYKAFRRVLDGFHHDLAVAELTLSNISDEKVTLPLRLANIHLDLDEDGQATDSLIGIMNKLMGRSLEFEGNTEFLVHFDRGDVAWLRAYCHLLMGILDFQLTFDLEPTFNLMADELFTNPQSPYKGKPSEKWRKLREAAKVVFVKDPVRLNDCRKHLLTVCELNHETWRFIRAEQDDEFEWLPSARQKGVLGLPVTDAMIDAWLGMIDEFAGLLNGKKLVPAIVIFAVGPAVDHGMSLRKLLEDPPEKFEWERIAEDGPAEKYLDPDGQDVDFLKIISVAQVFQNSLSVGYSVGYAAWFN